MKRDDEQQFGSAPKANRSNRRPEDMYRCSSIRSVWFAYQSAVVVAQRAWNA
jgi:hypothetical protein